MQNIRLDGKNCIKALTGSFILAFGIYNIHSVAYVTEGGIIGLTLLLDHWFGISPAVSNFILTSLCFIFGYSQLGNEFVINSVIAYSGYSLFYAVFEHFPRIYPEIAAYPLAAAAAGAVFVGVGTGISISGIAAITGDDALAMGLKHRFNIPLIAGYGILDGTVLILALSYISPLRLIYSVITVLISGAIIGFMNREIKL